MEVPAGYLQDWRWEGRDPLHDHIQGSPKWADDGSLERHPLPLCGIWPPTDILISVYPVRGWC